MTVKKLGYFKKAFLRQLKKFRISIRNNVKKMPHSKPKSHSFVTFEDGKIYGQIKLKLNKNSNTNFIKLTC